MKCSEGKDGGCDNNGESFRSDERPSKKRRTMITDYFNYKTRDEERLKCKRKAEEMSDCGRETFVHIEEESSTNDPKSGTSQEKPNDRGKSEGKTEVGNEFSPLNDMVYEYKFTIYKLHPHCLEVKAGVDIKSLHKSVENVFSPMEGIDLHETWQKCGDFDVIWYIYKTEIDRNKRSEMIAKDFAKNNTAQTTADKNVYGNKRNSDTMTDDEDEDSRNVSDDWMTEDESEGEILSNRSDGSTTDDENEERDSICSRDFVPGHRNTTNVLAVCKMTTGGPVVFCLLDGRQPTTLLSKADSEFPVKVANLLMDDSKIKKLDTLNIAGPAIKTSKSFLWSESSGMLFNGPNWSLNEIVTEATSSISKSNQISSILKSQQEDVKITIGQYFVRVEKKLPKNSYIEFLEYLIKEMDPSRDGKITEFYNFGYVHKIEKRYNAGLCKRYEQKLKQKAINYFLDENLDTIFLSVAQPHIRDWMTTTNVVLTRNKVTIKEWPFAPSMADIRTALHKRYKEELKNKLQSTTAIQLSFSISNNPKIMKRDLFHYVHGSVADEDKGIVAHKVSGKWYSVAGEYSDIVDKSFFDLMKNVFLNSKTDSSGYPKLPLPWRKVSKFSGEELAKAFDLHDPKLLEDIIDILSEETSFVKGDLVCDLTAVSCLFPERSQIFKDISKDVSKLYPKQLDGKSITKKDTYVHQVEFYLYNSIMQDRPCDWIQRSSPELQNELQRKRKIIMRVNGTNSYEVLNASLTTSMLKKLWHVSTKLEEKAVVSFLRSRMNLKEEEYNETYLLENGFILGDQILVHNKVIELFDILKHERDTKTTFLYHVKQGFGHDTRVSCSQIRVSAEVLWRDRIQGKSTHVDLFYKKALEGADSLRRTMLKELFQNIDVEEFRNFFSIETKLVFVFAFMDDKKDFVLENIGPLNVSEFTRIAKECKTDSKNMMDGLKSENILTDAGFLRDTFIDVTKQSFPDLIKTGKTFQSMTRDSLEKIYDILAKHRCRISTIPKVELLELDREFAHYQKGGKRIFEFKILQIT